MKYNPIYKMTYNDDNLLERFRNRNALIKDSKISRMMKHDQNIVPMKWAFQKIASTY